MWSDVAYLCKTIKKVNSNGVEVEEFIEKEVWCNEKSVGMNEFYQSSKAGVEIKVILVVKLADYEKEKYLKYDDELYNITRTYKVKNENVELHCSLKEGTYECGN